MLTFDPGIFGVRRRRGGFPALPVRRRRGAGSSHDRACDDRCIPGHRGRAGRRAGDGGARQGRDADRRPGRQGGDREPRARAGRASRLRPVDAGQAGDGEPRAGRSSQGRQPLRPADRPRPDGGAGRDPARCACRLCRARRIGARRHHGARGGRAAGGDRRQRAGQGADLPASGGGGGGMGGLRHRHPRAAQPDRHRQPFPRRAGAVATRARRARGTERSARPRRHQGAGGREARAGGRGRRRA